MTYHPNQLTVFWRGGHSLYFLYTKDIVEVPFCTKTYWIYQDFEDRTSKQKLTQKIALTGSIKLARFESLVDSRVRLLMDCRGCLRNQIILFTYDFVSTTGNIEYVCILLYWETLRGAGTKIKEATECFPAWCPCRVVLEGDSKLVNILHLLYYAVMKLGPWHKLKSTRAELLQKQTCIP